MWVEFFPSFKCVPCPKYIYYLLDFPDKLPYLSSPISPHPSDHRNDLLVQLTRIGELVMAPRYIPLSESDSPSKHNKRCVRTELNRKTITNGE